MDSSSTTESVTQSPDLDWFLQALVDVVNTTESWFSITLNVGGLIISGELIPGDKYFSELTKNFEAGGFPPEDANVFNRFGDIYKELRAQSKEEKAIEAATNPPMYIHLMNAQIVHPSGKTIPSNGGCLWRGRLDAVDGFIWGRTATSSDNKDF